MAKIIVKPVVAKSAKPALRFLLTKGKIEVEANQTTVKALGLEPFRYVAFLDDEAMTVELVPLVEGDYKATSREQGKALGFPCLGSALSKHVNLRSGAAPASMHELSDVRVLTLDLRPVLAEAPGVVTGPILNLETGQEPLSSELDSAIPGAAQRQASDVTEKVTETSANHAKETITVPLFKEGHRVRVTRAYTHPTTGTKTETGLVGTVIDVLKDCPAVKLDNKPSPKPRSIPPEYLELLSEAEQIPHLQGNPVADSTPTPFPIGTKVRTIKSSIARAGNTVAEDQRGMVTRAEHDFTDDGKRVFVEFYKGGKAWIRTELLEAIS